MNATFGHFFLAAALAAGLFAAGCGPGGKTTAAGPTEPPRDHEHGHEHDHDQDHKGHGGHDDGEGEAESSSPALFQPGHGVTLTAETRKLLGIESAEVVEAALPAEIRFTAQIFGERHRHLPNPSDHSGCDVHGSGLVTQRDAARLEPGDPVEVQHPSRGPLHGVVLGIHPAPALGESEVIIGISNAIAVLRPGEFVPSFVLHHTDSRFPTVPQSAVLRTAEGTFVYVAKDDAFQRTPVRVGNDHDARIAITEGLPIGSRVVTHGVQALWLIELRATKGGGHSH